MVLVLKFLIELNIIGMEMLVQIRHNAYIYLAQTSEIGQGLVRFLSCGARKQEQT